QRDLLSLIHLMLCHRTSSCEISACSSTLFTGNTLHGKPGELAELEVAAPSPSSLSMPPLLGGQGAGVGGRSRRPNRLPATYSFFFRLRGAVSCPHYWVLGGAA